MEQKPKKETWNIYVELQQLLREVYRTLFGMPKKDRVVLGDRIMSAATDALTFYNLAYKFMESRDYYKLLFVREYTKLKELLRLASTLKVVAESSHVNLFVYMQRIDDSYRKWDKATRKRIFQASAESNDDRVSGNTETRGGDGLKMFRKKLVLNSKKNCFNLKKGIKIWSNSP